MSFFGFHHGYSADFYGRLPLSQLSFIRASNRQFWNSALDQMFPNQAEFETVRYKSVNYSHETGNSSSNIRGSMYLKEGRLRFQQPKLGYVTKVRLEEWHFAVPQYVKFLLVL